MRLDDRLLAIVGRLVSSIERRGRWLPGVAAIGLATLSIIPVLVVGATPEPSDVSFPDLEAGQLPAMTSWLRLEGDLRDVPKSANYTFTYPWIYTLRDTTGSGLAVTIVALSPLDTGHTQITGRISGALSYEGTFASIEADIPTKPGRQDPWPLFSLPGVVALGLVIGLRTGYPVIRRDAAGVEATRLLPEDRVPANWSGRLEGLTVPLDAALPCRLSVVAGSDTCDLVVADDQSTRKLTVRRASPKPRIRICFAGGCLPAVEVHAPAGDLVLAFADRDARDRLGASLE